MTRFAHLLKLALNKAGRPDLADAILDVHVHEEEETEHGLMISGCLEITTAALGQMSAMQVVHEADLILRLYGLGAMIKPTLTYRGGPNPNMN
jgi:hypothetical protein